MGCGQSKKEESYTPSADGVDAAAKFISTVPIFSQMDQNTLRTICKKMDGRFYQQGDVVFRQGETGTEFFLIVDGKAKVTISKDGEAPQVFTLGKGDYFGEKALINKEARAGTITAESEFLKTLVLSEKSFNELNIRGKVNFGQRQAVQAEKVDVFSQQALEKVPKDEESMILIMDAVRNEEALKGVVDNLHEGLLRQCAEVARPVSFKAGTIIIKYGDPVADDYYILAKGSVDVAVPRAKIGNDQAKADSAGGGGLKTVAVFSAPHAFGGVALLYGTPRTASVTAVEDCECFTIKRKAFKQILMQVSAAKLQEYMTFMEKVEVLANLNQQEKRAVAQALTECNFEKGEMVINEGEAGACLYLVLKGDLNAEKRGEGIVQTYSAGDFFGERALLNHENRAASVGVTSDSATLLVIDKESFELVRAALDPKGNQTSKSDKFGKVSKEDLKEIGPLGAGGFGYVMLMKHKSTGEYFAMKALSKGHLVANDMQASAIAEKEILMMLDHPCIVVLYNTYKDPQTLYFLMEACIVGDLYLVLNRQQLYGRPDCAAYYSAVVIESFVYLHSKRVVYRDLKPENVLLNEKGQAKMCDMGIAKVVVGRTYTLCGTPEYMAPEIIQQKGHGHAVDWWCLGVFCYELLAGDTPFSNASTLGIYKAINKGIDKIKWSAKVSGAEKEQVRELCAAQPSRRLPMLPDGVKKLQEKPLYKKINFAMLGQPAFKVPYDPKIEDPAKAVKGRVHEGEIDSIKVHYVDDGSNWDAAF